MTHDPLCPNAKGCPHDCGGCSCNRDAFCQCDLIAMVRADEHSRHDGCLCERSVTEFWQDGALQWVFIDGRKFVPQETL